MIYAEGDPIAFDAAALYADGLEKESLRNANMLWAIVYAHAGCLMFSLVVRDRGWVSIA